MLLGVCMCVCVCNGRATNIGDPTMKRYSCYCCFYELLNFLHEFLNSNSQLLLYHPDIVAEFQRNVLFTYAAHSVFQCIPFDRDNDHHCKSHRSCTGCCNVALEKKDNPLFTGVYTTSALNRHNPPPPSVLQMTLENATLVAFGEYRLVGKTEEKLADEN